MDSNCIDPESHVIKPNKRGHYQKLDDGLKVKIGRFAAQNGNIEAVRRFGEYKLSESTVRGKKKHTYFTAVKQFGAENI